MIEDLDGETDRKETKRRLEGEEGGGVGEADPTLILAD